MTLKHAAAMLIAIATMAFSAPASATIFTYNMTNGDRVVIDTANGTGTWIGEDMKISFASEDLKNVTAGTTPSFSATLTDLTGYRIIDGTKYNPSLTSRGKTKAPKLIGEGDGRLNLWSYWGDPSAAGDYIRRIGGMITDVPAPGMLGLFGLALFALGLRRRRKSAPAAA